MKPFKSKFSITFDDDVINKLGILKRMTIVHFLNISINVFVRDFIDDKAYT